MREIFEEDKAMKKLIFLANLTFVSEGVFGMLKGRSVLTKSDQYFLRNLRTFN